MFEDQEPPPPKVGHRSPCPDCEEANQAAIYRTATIAAGAIIAVGIAVGIAAGIAKLRK